MRVLLVQASALMYSEIFLRLEPLGLSGLPARYGPRATTCR